MTMDLKAWVARHFDSRQTVAVHWYWEPFHSAGLRAITWAENQSVGDGRFKGILDHLSATAATAEHRRRLPDAVDSEGRLKPLDPAPKIWETWTLSGDPSFAVFKVQDLRTVIEGKWTPHVPFSRLSSFWSPKSRIHETVEGLEPWNRLLLLESLEGLTNSQTTLEFQRIDEKRPFS